jgi:hypothetical protein
LTNCDPSLNGRMLGACISHCGVIRIQPVCGLELSYGLSNCQNALTSASRASGSARCRLQHAHSIRSAPSISIGSACPLSLKRDPNQSV